LGTTPSVTRYRAGIKRAPPSVDRTDAGDLKANQRDLLVKYVDASLHFAHWLFLEVAFRYPKDLAKAGL
jgi:hypothetical protein